MENTHVVIIGGGLAGLTAAIHLSKAGLRVILIEKNNFPKHKVCGEYISSEVLPYLNWLEVSVQDLEPTTITKLQFSSANGTTLNHTLPLGGFGISRYILDDFLYKKAVANGCQIIQETVTDVDFIGDDFTITTSDNSIINSKIVLGAFGKRSTIDQKLQRDFIQKNSSWLAVKAHYSGTFPNDLVGLHNFEGGYCGVSKVENDKINVCYLADYATFKRYKNLAEYQKEIVCKNSHLKTIFESCTLLFDKPLTISQISFEKKKTIENHMLMIGDSAGLIHPLCGNGMAMAIHSAKIASELVIKFYDYKIKHRVDLEKQYRKEWDFNFKRRLQAGRLLSSILQKPKLAEVLIRMLVGVPFLFPLLIKNTHGKPIQ